MAAFLGSLYPPSCPQERPLAASTGQSEEQSVLGCSNAVVSSLGGVSCVLFEHLAIITSCTQGQNGAFDQETSGEEAQWGTFPMEELQCGWVTGPQKYLNGFHAASLCGGLCHSWPEIPPWAIYQSTSDNWQHRSGCRVGWGSATAHSQTRHHTELAFRKHTQSRGHSPASCWRLTPGDHREQREVFPDQGEMTNGKVVLAGCVRQGERMAAVSLRPST